MSEGNEVNSLQMRCDELKLIKGVGLPAGYTLRYFAEGDEKKWLDIHLQADPSARARADLFRKQFGYSNHLLGWRQLYLYDPQNEAVGTVTAWYDDAEFMGPYWGRLHWLALLPTLHGHGLGDLLVAACLQCLCQLGHRKAYLFTDDRRIPAINLYLKYGFRPVVRTVADEETWRRLAPQLKYPSFP